MVGAEKEGEDASGEPDYSKLERAGFQVGVRIVERLTLEKPRFSDSLDAVKFICKDFWTAVFKKQVDNLKTNHKVRLRPYSERSAKLIHGLRQWLRPRELVRSQHLSSPMALRPRCAGCLRTDGQQLSVD